MTPRLRGFKNICATAYKVWVHTDDKMYHIITFPDLKKGAMSDFSSEKYIAPPEKTRLLLVRDQPSDVFTKFSLLVYSEYLCLVGDMHFQD